jgi:hypothetical protein
VPDTQFGWRPSSERNFIQTWRSQKENKAKGNVSPVPTQEARHEDGGIAPLMLTTWALDGHEWLVSRPGYFTPEKIATQDQLNRAVGGIQCRSGRFGEETALLGPYENRTTIPRLLSLWFSHYTD